MVPPHKVCGARLPVDDTRSTALKHLLLAIALRGCSLQVCAACLEGGFDRPSWWITRHDPLRAQAQSSCQAMLIAMGSCTIRGIDPTDFPTRFPDTVPVPRARDDLDRARGASRPRDHEARPCGRFGHHLLGGSPLPTLHARAAQRVACARGGRCIPRGIPIKLADDGQVTAMVRAKPCGLAGAVAHVAYEDDVTLRKPADETCQQPSGAVRWRLLPRAMRTIPLGGTVPGDHNREGPGPSRERPFHEPRYGDPCMPPAIGRRAVRDDRTPSRCRPWPNTLGPGCSVTVSSPARSTGPDGTTWSSKNLIRACAITHVDHRRWEHTRWS